MRLGRADFSAEVPSGNETKTVRFPAEWPGDALVIFPHLAKQLEANPEYDFWEGTLVKHATLTAAGQLGCKGKPDEHGNIVIDYRVNPAFQGRGYATEMVGALTVWLLEQRGVTRVTWVTAECLKTNIASACVPQRTDFKLVGEMSVHEGSLLVWARTS